MSHHTVLACMGLLPAVTQAPLSVTFSTTLPTTILCICVCVPGVCIQRWGDGGHGDLTVSQRTIPLLMRLSALCLDNEDQSVEMEGGKK